jgi:cysteine synthase A
MICESIPGPIGRTPIVCINRLAPQHVTMCLKVEFFNPASPTPGGTTWVPI